MPDCLFRRLWRLGKKLIKEKPNFLGLHDGARSFGQRAFKNKTTELRAPKLPIRQGSVDEWTSVANGTKFDDTSSYTDIYGATKLMGTLWSLSMARKYPKMRFMTFDPGMARDTSGTKSLPVFQRITMEVAMWVMEKLGRAHSVDVGAKRYVDVMLNNNDFTSGVWWGSKKALTGELANQETYWPDIIGNETAQDNANIAIRKFL